MKIKIKIHKTGSGSGLEIRADLFRDLTKAGGMLAGDLSRGRELPEPVSGLADPAEAADHAEFLLIAAHNDRTASHQIMYRLLAHTLCLGDFIQ